MQDKRHKINKSCIVCGIYLKSYNALRCMSCHKNRFFVEDTKLIDLYVNKKLTAKKIAQQLGFKTKKPILDRLHKLGITMRYHGDYEKSLELREYHRQLKLGKHISPTTEFKKGHQTWNKGKEYFAIQWEKHPNFKSGSSAYRRLIKRLNKQSTCEKCGVKNPFGTKMHIHHIDRNRDNNDLNNLQVLCSKCHLHIHQNWLKRKRR